MQQNNKEEIKVGDIVCYEYNEYGYVSQIDELMIQVYWFKHCIASWYDMDHSIFTKGFRKVA